MNLTTERSVGPIVSHQPDEEAPVHEWVDWFWASFLPGWIVRARDPHGIGFFDLLDEDAQPGQPDRRTVLAQARLLYTFSHLALISDNKAYHDAARVAREAVPAFLKAPGVYRRATTGTGQPTGDPDDNLATSYDQSFVILGLATWGRLHPTEDVEPDLEACWSALETLLTDPLTGLMLEHDRLDDPSAASAPNRAQNPHMHLFEVVCPLKSGPP